MFDSEAKVAQKQTPVLTNEHALAATVNSSGLDGNSFSGKKAYRFSSKIRNSSFLRTDNGTTCAFFITMRLPPSALTK
ncbi:hypothetical protein SAMN02927903_02287 [Flavobacterium caeni]|uniref:Uncharacterized protein n=1 Tax=Flavobacterium caeni TaxID=490189 RepID=A0A1G5IKT8_9FLAO|nr:hypothetical protein SAMN02927903_02287 [Flavobacterium caeni]